MKAVLTCAALVAALLAPPAAHAQQERKLVPVDEAAKDASWVSFRNRLLNALQAKDRKYLMSLVDRNVRNTASGERGIAEFQKQWDLAANDSPLWRELASALYLGAAWLERDKGRKELCAPYVLAKWPEDLDPFDHGAIVAKETTVMSAPSTASQAVRTLSYDLVRVTDWDVPDRDAASPQRWVKVNVGGEGYVPEEHVRSPIEHAACFVKGPNGWRMVAFAPAGGD